MMRHILRFSFILLFKLRDIDSFFRSNPFRTVGVRQVFADLAQVPSSSPHAKINFVNESYRYTHNFVEADSLAVTDVNTVTIVPKSKYDEWAEQKLSKFSANIILEMTAVNLTTFPGLKSLLIPNMENTISHVIFFDDMNQRAKPFRMFDLLWSNFKNKTYVFEYFGSEELPGDIADKMMISWALSSYKLSWFKRSVPAQQETKIVWPKNCNVSWVKSTIRAHTLVRDLVDTPAMALGPQELEEVAITIAKELNATKVTSIVGVNDLEAANFSQVAAVGQGSPPGREPRFVDVTWEAPPGHDWAPHVVIVGKGGETYPSSTDQPQPRPHCLQLHQTPLTHQ